MEWKWLLSSFKGRISRLYWWVGTIVVILADYAISIPALWALGGDPAYYWNDDLPTPKVSIADIIAFFTTLHLALAIDIKRIHDRGRSAYFLVPVYLFGLSFILAQSFTIDILFAVLIELEQEGGVSLKAILFGAIFIALSLYTIWYLIELGFRKGVNGSIAYGADPLGPVPVADEPERNS